MRSPGKWLLLVLALVAAHATAVIETYEFSDSLLEERYQQLSGELRCPKCQNQNIADSNAPISQDLRRLLYEQLEAGADDEQILDDMVARYGEFVRYRPSFSSAWAAMELPDGIAPSELGFVRAMSLSPSVPAKKNPPPSTSAKSPTISSPSFLASISHFASKVASYKSNRPSIIKA